MKKYLGLVFLWSVVIATGLGLRSAGPLRADPTDDFSLTLQRLPESVGYRIMPEIQITHIFQDHLDLFPKKEAPKLARHLLELCKRHQFDPAFVLALIQVESSLARTPIKWRGI